MNGNGIGPPSRLCRRCVAGIPTHRSPSEEALLFRHLPFRKPRTIVAALCLFGFCTGAAAPEPTLARNTPRRVVSLNVCADQLVIALADRRQIAALTDWSRDPVLSYYARAARGLPVMHRSAEEIVALKPDLVIAAPYRTRAILAPSGVRMVELPPQDSYAALIASITALAAAVGHPERGRALIARMEGELKALGPPPGRGRVAAYYQREGYLTGTGTLVDDMMRRAGLTNLAIRAGRTPLTRIGLEQMALARPDFLIMEQDALAADDRGSAMLRHPLLTRAISPSRHIVIPQALTVCATPGYPRAVGLLIAGIRAVDLRAPR